MKIDTIVWLALAACYMWFIWKMPKPPAGTVQEYEDDFP